MQKADYLRAGSPPFVEGRSWALVGAAQRVARVRDVVVVSAIALPGLCLEGDEGQDSARHDDRSDEIKDRHLRPSLV